MEPAVRLSRQEVPRELQLIKRGGLLGQGATAYVFKALWPSRFGVHNLLAVKVMKDGYNAELDTLQSFTYEALVLADLE
jgi:hypothetical protein